MDAIRSEDATKREKGLKILKNVTKQFETEKSLQKEENEEDDWMYNFSSLK